MQPGASVAQSVKAIGFVLDSRGSILGRIREDIFFFATASRPVPTYTPIQWVPGALFPEVK
jgi:hypothetical protein